MIKRNTVQRTMVLDTIRKMASHPTADEVYAEVIKVCPQISRATVYRNLHELCEAGEIMKREIPGFPDHYDHMTTNHYHVVCSECGCVYDVELDEMPDIEKHVVSCHNFEITGHSIVFQGLCPECLEKRQGK